MLNVIAEAGLVLEHVNSVRRDQDRTLWEITVEIDADAHEGLLERLNALPTARFIVLCFPGLFDAALRARARAFTDSMLVAAATALAAAAPAGQLLPDPLESSIHERVSQAVQSVVAGTGQSPAAANVVAPREVP